MLRYLFRLLVKWSGIIASPNTIGGAVLHLGSILNIGLDCVSVYFHILYPRIQFGIAWLHFVLSVIIASKLILIGVDLIWWPIFLRTHASALRPQPLIRKCVLLWNEMTAVMVISLRRFLSLLVPPLLNLFRVLGLDSVLVRSYIRIAVKWDSVIDRIDILVVVKLHLLLRQASLLAVSQWGSPLHINWRLLVTLPTSKGTVGARWITLLQLDDLVFIWIIIVLATRSISMSRV